MCDVDHDDSEMETDNGPESSQPSWASLDQRTIEEILYDDKNISCEKIELIYIVLYCHPLGVLSPDRQRFAKLLIGILYQLTEQEVELIDKWVRRNRKQLKSWPYAA